MRNLLLVLLAFVVVSGCETTIRRASVPVDSSVVKDMCLVRVGKVAVAAHTISVIEDCRVSYYTRCRRPGSRIVLTSGGYVFVRVLPAVVLAELEKCKRKLRAEDGGSATSEGEE